MHSVALLVCCFFAALRSGTEAFSVRNPTGQKSVAHQRRFHAYDSKKVTDDDIADGRGWYHQSFATPVSQTSKMTTSRRELIGSMLFTATALSNLSPQITSTSTAHAADLSDFQEGPKGLKYLVTNEGTGAKPERGQKVKTTYTLFLDGFPEDGGKQMDSSKRLLGEQPFEFVVGVGQVVPGWDLALMDMQVGESRRLVVPSDIGYGSKGFSKIPGGATLYFDVALTELGKAPQLNDEQRKWLEEHPLGAVP